MNIWDMCGIPNLSKFPVKMKSCVKVGFDRTPEYPQNQHLRFVSNIPLSSLSILGKNFSRRYFEIFFLIFFFLFFFF